MKSGSSREWSLLKIGVILTVALNGVSELEAGPPTIGKVSEKEIEALIAKNRGKVVLVSYFATWCPPCVKEFPDIVKVDRNYRSKGLVVIGVSVDDPADKKTLQSFLREKKTGFTVYLAEVKSDAFFPNIDKRWEGDIPLTMIYDRTGKLRYFYLGMRSYAELAKGVRSLLRRG
jgi:thiol-disulfide isomerase/thioredoxin